MAIKSKAKKVTASVPKLGKISKPYTKAELYSTLASRTGLSKKEVSGILNDLCLIIEGHLKKAGPGKFVLPGIFKMVVKNIPARKAREGINPFTKEPTIFKAKPASRKVKVIALKGLKAAII